MAIAFTSAIYGIITGCTLPTASQQESIYTYVSMHVDLGKLVVHIDDAVLP
jgi:hypothetical protein